jgi:hypothetical protein
MRPLSLLLVCALAGCATLPERPAVSFYLNPDPMLIPQTPVDRPGLARKLTPPDLPAPICLTEADHLALEGYFDQLDAWRARH